MNKRTFTKDEIALIHRTMMEGAKPDDVALFVATCERTGLDPFARQIMPSVRNTQKNGQWVMQWTWIVTIDGLRKIAVDSGDYEGQEGPFWCGKDGIWKEIWTEDKPCFAAKVLVHRKGFRCGLAGIAKYNSYVQKKKDGQPNQVWQNLGDHMTAKCAEALALRRAYPNEMAGLYTDEELEQAALEAHEQKAEPSVNSDADIVWTEDELASARAMVMELAEALLEAGMAEEGMREVIGKPSQLIGANDLRFSTWENRLLGLRERQLKKLAA